MNEPVGWRDVTEAINKLRDDLLIAIRSRDKRLDNHDDRLDDVEKKLEFFSAREDGIRLVLRATIATVALIATILAIAKALGSI